MGGTPSPHGTRMSVPSRGKCLDWTQKLFLPVVSSRQWQNWERRGWESECLILRLHGASIASSVPIVFVCDHHTQPPTSSPMIQSSLSKFSPWPSLVKTPGLPYTFHNPRRTKQLHSQEFIQLLTWKGTWAAIVPMEWAGHMLWSLESEGQGPHWLTSDLGKPNSSETQPPHIWSGDHSNNIVVKIKLNRLLESRIYSIQQCFSL